MRDVLSGVSKNGMGCFVPGCFVLHSILRVNEITLNWFLINALPFYVKKVNVLTSPRMHQTFDKNLPLFKIVLFDLILYGPSTIFQL